MSRESKSVEELLPSTYLTVLTLIGSGAKYGYEIDRLIEDRGYREWVDIRMPSVYKALRELEERGLIAGEKSEAGFRPPKKTYSLTSKGRRVLKSQIRQCLSNPPRSKTIFDLGMSAMFLLSQQEVLGALHEQVDSIDRAIGFLHSNVQAIEDMSQLQKTEPERKIGGRPVTDFRSDEPLDLVHALFDRPRAMLECRRQWLLKLIRRIEGAPERFGLRSEKERR
jgi:DNA-binding PadR family transcriptional regulator